MIGFRHSRWSSGYSRLSFRTNQVGFISGLPRPLGACGPDALPAFPPHDPQGAMMARRPPAFISENTQGRKGSGAGWEASHSRYSRG